MKNLREMNTHQFDARNTVVADVAAEYNAKLNALKAEYFGKIAAELKLEKVFNINETVIEAKANGETIGIHVKDYVYKPE